MVLFKGFLKECGELGSKWFPSNFWLSFNDLKESRLTREPIKIKEMPCHWLKELVYKRNPPKEENLYYQVLSLRKDFDVDLK